MLCTTNAKEQWGMAATVTNIREPGTVLRAYLESQAAIIHESSLTTPTLASPSCLLSWVVLSGSRAAGWQGLLVMCSSVCTGVRLEHRVYGTC